MTNAIVTDTIHLLIIKTYWTVSTFSAEVLEDGFLALINTATPQVNKTMGQENDQSTQPGFDQSGKRRYCSMCDKSFTSNWGYTCHMRLHTGSKPFECPACHKRFTQKSNMRSHFVAIHSQMELSKHLSVSEILKWELTCQKEFCLVAVLKLEFSFVYLPLFYRKS